MKLHTLKIPNYASVLPPEEVFLCLQKYILHYMLALMI